MRILVAEDELDLADALEALLTFQKYQVDVVYDGEDAVYYAQDVQYDAIILDVMMPKLNGYQVVEQLRKNGNLTPVLMLTAKNQLEDKVKGLDLGSDDYLTKPFQSEELLARLRSLLRRPASYIPDKLQFSDLTVDKATFTMQANGKEVLLNNKEFQLMEFFLINSGQVVSKEQLMEKIWGYESEAEINVVWVNISSLRKKLQAIQSRVKIVSARGLGYQLKEDVHD